MPGGQAMHELIDTKLNWWVLLTLATSILLLIAEVGFRLGLRHRDETIENHKAQTSILVGAMLALLGLLLAFSFGIVQERFAERKALVLEEANAVGTTFRRSEFLPPPRRERVRELLRSYVAARVTLSPHDLQHALELSESIHDDLWKEAAEAGREAPDSEMLALFVESMNEVIDLHESRVTVALYQRTPAPILITLCLVSLLSLGAVGFSAGLTRWRSLLPNSVLALAVSSVFTLIVELDRPFANRLFRVNQAAMHDVQREIGER
jgi:hypothetical protein